MLIVAVPHQVIGSTKAMANHAELAVALMIGFFPLVGWRERRPPMDPFRYVSARLLDDVAYSLGVWRGCVRHRTARPLPPRLTWRATPGAGRPGICSAGRLILGPGPR